MDHTVTISEKDLGLIVSALRNEYTRISRHERRARENGHSTDTLDQLMHDLYTATRRIELQTGQ